MEIVQRAVKKIRVITGLDIDWSEHKKSFGEMNPDVTFYVIRRGDRLAGINSHFINNMGHLRYAIAKGWIPIIDMQTYANALLEPDEVGIKNAWDYYFKQPLDDKYSLEEIYQSKNVILSSGGQIVPYPNDSMEFFSRPELIQMWNQYFLKYVNFNERMQEEIEKKYRQYLQDKKEERIVGIFLRGTDYLSLKPYEHPVQPSVTQAIAKTWQVMKAFDCKWVYLVTEDLAILEEFQREFANQLIYIKEQERYRSLAKGEHIAEHSFQREHDRYLKGKECLLQMGLLMKCNCLIGGRTSGSVATMVMQPHYDYTYFWNLGRYGMDDILEEV